ncbi:MAG: glycosyltransferase family 9 protein [Verrucomicrobiota bacterium]
MKFPFAVVYYKQLGDTLLTEPALNAMAEYHGAPVGILCRPGFEDLVSLMGERVVSVQPRPWVQVDRILCGDSGSRSAARALILRSAKREVIVENDEQVRRIHRLGRFSIQHHPMEREYRARWLWRAAVGDRVPVEAFRPPRLQPPPRSWREGVENVDFIEQKPLLLHVSSAWKRKCWQPRCWAELIQSCETLKDRPILISAGPQEWEQQLAGQVIQQVKRADVKSLGVMSFRQFLWVLNEVSAILAIDGAAAHLGQAFGKPVLTLFGASDVAQWHWQADKNQALVAPEGSMNLLLVSDVSEKLLSWLEA